SSTHLPFTQLASMRHDQSTAHASPVAICSSHVLLSVSHQPPAPHSPSRHGSPTAGPGHFPSSHVPIAQLSPAMAAFSPHASPGPYGRRTLQIDSSLCGEHEPRCQLSTDRLVTKLWQQD